MSNATNERQIMNIEPTLSISKYSKADCKIGVVHIGSGAFHRAHQAFYLDQYMEQSGDLNWGIATVDLRAENSGSVHQPVDGRDGYVLRTISANGEKKAHFVRSHFSLTNWWSDKSAATDLIIQPSVKLITMTVTESGYYLDSNAKLDLNNPVIKSELSGGEGASIYAYLRTALTARSKNQAGPITILCCDNIRNNGAVLKSNFIRYLELVGDLALVDWLTKNASFPSCMVDRITPKPTQTLSAETEEEFGIKNDFTILSEDFIQWVVEKDFKSDFPSLEDVGVTITADIKPYEETKVRVLNGGHSCIAYLGALKGYKTFDTLLLDDELKEHFWEYEKNEVLPALPANLSFDKDVYLQTIADRFSNMHISDTVERICQDGFNKLPLFILPTIRGCFEAGLLPIFGIRSIASWYIFARSIHKGVLTFNYKEAHWDQFAPLLEDGCLDKFINNKQLWGSISNDYPTFASILKDEVRKLEKRWPL